MIKSTHLANTFVVVPPTQFKFNDQTSIDNKFQNKIDECSDEIQSKALVEFNNMIMKLREEKFNVIIFDFPDTDFQTPDSVFPNNWFSTTPEGELFLYTMASENRRAESKPELLISELNKHNKKVKQTITIGDNNSVLEGTGAMIIDHKNNNIYAALSNRCNTEALKEFTTHKNINHVYEFKTQLPSGGIVYHTNVMLSIGEDLVVICEEAIIKTDRQRIVESFYNKKDVIFITIEQMMQFCGNILQIENKNSEKYIAMSTSAKCAFTDEQISTLQNHGEILSFDIPTIQKVGGGGVRCMLTEIFLPDSAIA